MQATEQGKVLAGKLKMESADRSPPKPHIKFDTYNFNVYTQIAYRRKAVPGIDTVFG